MIVITLSYDEERELMAITRRLDDLPLKISKDYQTGQHHRVYLRGNLPDPGRRPDKQSKVPRRQSPEVG